MKQYILDTGIGMADEFQKYIFEPFAQEHAGSRTKFAGTGLGMAISKKLVEKMGGTITFESKKGVGTTFVIRVPFKIDRAADANGGKMLRVMGQKARSDGLTVGGYGNKKGATPLRELRLYAYRLMLSASGSRRRANECVD